MNDGRNALERRMVNFPLFYVHTKHTPSIFRVDLDKMCTENPLSNKSLQSCSETVAQLQETEFP